MGNAIKKESALNAGAGFSERVLDIAVRRFYRANRTHARRIEALSPRSFRITFSFPAQERSLNPPAHVTAVQMTEGLVEAIFCAVTGAVFCGEEPFSLLKDDLYKVLRQIIFLEQETTYRKLVDIAEETDLEITIDEISLVRLAHKIYLIEFSYDGFVKGQSRVALDAAFVRDLLGRDLLDNVVPLRLHS